MVTLEQLISLGVALAIGLLIGIERGWQQRASQEGERIAGIRTFGLIGLLGGLGGLLADHFNAYVLGLMFIGVAGVVTVAYLVNLPREKDIGITSLIAALLTFVLGAMATLGHIFIAAAAAVSTTVLLGMKPVLHGWLRKLEKQDLHAALKLLLITIVVLPILPNRGYGPWEAVNPYEIWWMVVLIAGLSFSGYITMKAVGAEKGVMLTAVLAGLVSSTALTLYFARLSRTEAGLDRLLAPGILLACSTVFPRILLVASIINTSVFSSLVAPLTVMTVITILPVIFLRRLGPAGNLPARSLLIKNPFQLKFALLFGVLLAAIILIGRAIREFMGETGIYMLAAISGVMDVDAITLTLSRMSLDDLPITLTATGIVIAGAVNTLLKAALAGAIGSSRVRRQVILPLAFAAGTGLVAAWMF